MFFKKIKVKPSERVVVTADGKLQQVLLPGSHTVFSFAKSMELFRHSLSTLNVQWPAIDDAIRFERKKVEQYWQVIDVPAGQVGVVWHQYLPAQVIVGEDSQAFWKPEAGEIQAYTFAREEVLLPQAVQQKLLLQKEIVAPLKKYTINADQKLIITVYGELKAILHEGEHVLYLDEESAQPMITNVRTRLFAATDLIEAWVQQQPELVAEYFECVQANGDEVVLCSYNGQLQNIVVPGTKRYFWKNAQDPLLTERVSLAEGVQISETVLTQLNAIEYQKHAVFSQCVMQVEVPEYHQGVLTIEHRGESVLSPGCYHFWFIHKPINWQLVDLRLQTTEISGQELLTEDKVTVRVNATCNYHVTDSLVWVSRYADPKEYLYKELQFAIRAVIGGRGIDALLADKQQVDAELAELMKQKNLQGIEIDTIGIKDIILPGEIRQILSQVVEAEKSAQANNIRRREETAATRSLLNTARVMEENPTALRLKELETLEKVTEKIDKISVYGGLDGVLNGLIHIQNPEDAGKKK